MNKIAETRRRFGYRRIGVMLERVGMIMNEKKLYRIYREEGYQFGAGVAANGHGAAAHRCLCAIAAEPTLVLGLPVRHFRGLPEFPHSGR